MNAEQVDVAIVGAGAAGLATAIFARRFNPETSVVLLEGARKPGAKILVSGGGRCNVTNRAISDADFWGGRRALIRRVLRAFTAEDAVRLFGELNVALHEEPDGKLFPDSHSARHVLSALLNAVEASGARLRAGQRVVGIKAIPDGFEVTTSTGVVTCRQLVLATGGQSLPKSGSDGTGFRFAEQLGHSIVPTTPALAPLVLATSANAFHRTLSGVSHDVELDLWIDGRIATRLTGSLLWTHFGISGPVAMNMSRHWLRAELEQRQRTVTVNFCPSRTFDDVDGRWAGLTSARPKSSIISALSTLIPSSVAAALLDRLALDPSRSLAHLRREDRRTLVHALVEFPLSVTGSRGYTYAEATAGGVMLDEVDMATMKSRVCPGLFLVGEILDVDGRIGGFNFQWAWSTAYVAAQGIARTP